MDGGCTGGMQMYKGMYRHTEVYRHMEGDMDTLQTYRQPEITPSCLPTTPEGICKKFFFPLIMSHVHHLSTEMVGKKPTKMPECTPINTNQNYPRK